MLDNKRNGIYSELLTAFLLKLENPNSKIIINHSRNCDIEMRKTNCITYFEVKSCKYEIKNKNSKRLGRFIIRENDLISDFFIFIIPDIHYIKIIETNKVKKYLDKKYLISKPYQVKLTQNEIKKL